MQGMNNLHLHIFHMNIHLNFCINMEAMLWYKFDIVSTCSLIFLANQITRSSFGCLGKGCLTFNAQIVLYIDSSVITPVDNNTLNRTLNKVQLHIATTRPYKTMSITHYKTKDIMTNTQK